MRYGTSQKNKAGEGRRGRRGVIKEREKTLSFLYRTDIGLLD